MASTSSNVASVEANSSSSTNTNSSSGGSTGASSGKSRSSPTPSSSNHKSLGEIWFHRMDDGTNKGDDLGEQTDLKLSVATRGASLSPLASNQRSTKNKNKRTNNNKDSKPSPNPRAPLSSLSTCTSDSESMSTHSATKNSSSTERKRRSSTGKDDISRTKTRGAAQPDETPTDIRSKRRKLLSDDKRKERNAREQGRSNKISDQFAELRELMVTSGIVVPKGTKGAVLSVVLEYIRVLQQTRVNTEAECQRMRQQLCSIRQGHCGPVAAKAVKAIARHNGVPSLTDRNTTDHRMDTGTFVSVPVHDISHHEEEDEEAPFMLETRNNMKDRQYKDVFEHGSVAMGIASLGGTFLDCNRLFCELAQYSKDQVRSLSIFNLTSREELSNAFDRLSSMLTADPSTAQPIVLHGSTPSQQLHIRLLDPSQSCHGTADGESADQASDCRRKLLLVTLWQSPCAVGGTVVSPQPFASAVEQEVPVASMEKPEQSADGYQSSSTSAFYYSVNA